MASSFSEPLQALLARQSLDSPEAPAPQGEILKAILSAGLCAPDHGRLRPWRWIVIEGEEHCGRLGKKAAEAAHRQNEAIGEKKLARLERRFASVPMIIGLGAEFVPASPISRQEQEYCVAAGAMNILNALSFSGFGGIWISGAYSQDSVFCKDLGLSEDPEKGGLLGFLLVGSKPAITALGAKKRPDLENYLKIWPESSLKEE